MAVVSDLCHCRYLSRKPLLTPRLQCSCSPLSRLRPEPTLGAGGDPNIHLLPSRIISDVLFPDVLKDLETNPPYIGPAQSAKTWVDPFDAAPEALFDETAAELAEEEATPENFDGVDYALALAIDTADLRAMWPDFTTKGQVFVRHTVRPPRASLAKIKPKAVVETASVRVWANGPVLAWCDAAQAENRSAPVNRIHLLQVAEMFQGSQPGTQSYAVGAEDKLCFTIKTHPKGLGGSGAVVLSLQAHSHEQRQQWWTALKSVMAYITGATESYNESNPSAEWTLQPAPAELIQDGFDLSDEPEFPDERGVPAAMVPQGPHGFAQDDAKGELALQAAEARREVLQDITQRMNNNAMPLLSTLLVKERQQDQRRRDKHLEEKEAKAEEARRSEQKRVRTATMGRSDEEQIADMPEPTTPAHLWFELINNLKYGVRVSSVSSEIALDSMGDYSEPSRDEFTAVSVVDKFSPVAADLRPRADREPTVVLQELAPTVFARLRRHLGIPLSEYVLEMGTAETFVRVLQTTDEDDAELCGPAGFPAPGGAITGAGSGRGKDRKTMWQTSTGQFWVQTLSEKQARFFASWMRQYYEHITEHRADSFLIRIIGMYHIRTPIIPSGKYMVVIRNPVSTDRYVHWRYEINGATPPAKAPDALTKQSVPVYYDADADEHKLELALRPQQLRLMVSQLRRDLQFLARVSAFGYRVSISVSHQDVTDKKTLDGTLEAPRSLGARYGLGAREREFTVLNEDVARMTEEEEDRYDDLLGELPPLDIYPPDVTALSSNWTLEAGGVLSSRWDDIEEEMFPDAICYYLSISDIFGEFDSQMAWDLWWGRQEAGSEFIDPAKYAVRFASAFEARCMSEHPEYIARRARAQAKKQEAAALAAAQAAARSVLPGITASGGVAMANNNNNSSSIGDQKSGFGGGGVGVTRGGAGVTRGGFGSGVPVSGSAPGSRRGSFAAPGGRDPGGMPLFNLTAGNDDNASGRKKGKYSSPLDIDLDDANDDDPRSANAGTAYADY